MRIESLVDRVFSDRRAAGDAVGHESHMMGSSVGYTYSSDFPQRSRARIAAVKIEAGLELEDSKRQLRWVSDLEAEIRKYILRVFIVFVEEAMELGRQRRWSVDRIDEQARKFLECTTFEAEREKGYFQSGRGMRIESLVDRVFSRIRPEVMRDFQRSSEWRQYQKMLLEIAHLQASAETLEPSEEAHGVGPPGNRRIAAPTTDVGQAEQLITEKHVDRAPPAARRHGYEAEVQRHQTIAEAVGRHYPGWTKGSSGWGQDSVLERICKDLDGSGVGVPETWRSGKTASLNGIKVGNWSEALELGYKKLVRDAIRYALKWFVTRGPAKTPDPS